MCEFFAEKIVARARRATADRVLCACARLSHKRFEPNGGTAGRSPWSEAAQSFISSTPLASELIHRHRSLQLSTAELLATLAKRYVQLLQLLTPFSCGNSGGKSSSEAACMRPSGCEHGSYDIVVLATFPRSGTTWTQKAWEAATGLAAEDVYDGGGRINASNHGSWYALSEGVRVRQGDESAFVKSHFCDWGCPPPAYGPRRCIVARVVHMIRNPFDQAIALFYFSVNGAPSPVLPMESDVRVLLRGRTAPFTQSLQAAWLQFATNSTRTFARWHFRASIAFRERPVLFVRYEDLTADPVTEFGRMFTFVLGSSSPVGAAALQALSRPGNLWSGGQVKHRGTAGLPGGLLPADVVDDPRFASEDAISAVSDALAASCAVGVVAGAEPADDAEEALGNGLALAPVYPWHKRKQDTSASGGDESDGE